MTYFQYLKKCILLIKSLSKKTGCSFIWLFFDYCSALLIHGCYIRQFVYGNFWSLSNSERKNRLTYPRMVRIFHKCNDVSLLWILNDKSSFNAFFRDYVKREWIRIPGSTKDVFQEFLQRNKEIIIKPVYGVEGDGIRIITNNNDNTIIDNEYDLLSNEHVIVEERIKPHPNMVFNNCSLNTIRTMTLIDKKGKAHVLKAILRAGVGESVVDNYAQGGIIYEVDISTGVVCSYGKSKSGQLHIYHPGSNIIMLGRVIPLWDEVIHLSINAAELLPKVGMVGWDIAITEDGCQIIEGNHNPDYELFEFLGSTGYYKIINKLL